MLGKWGLAGFGGLAVSLAQTRPTTKTSRLTGTNVKNAEDPQASSAHSLPYEDLIQSLRSNSGSNGFDVLHFSSGGTDSIGDIQCGEHGIVDVKPFGIDVEDLSCFRTTIHTRNGMKDT